VKMLLDVVRVEIVNLNEFRRPTSCKGGFVAKVERHGSSLVLTFMTPNLSKHICQSLIKIKQIKTHFNLVSQTISGGVDSIDHLPDYWMPLLSRYLCCPYSANWPNACRLYEILSRALNFISPNFAIF